MSNQNTFFYIKDCALCLSAVKHVAPFFAELGATLLYRKLPSELFSIVPGLPAVLVRKNLFNTQQDIIIVGVNMVEQLKVLKESKLSV